MCFTSHLQALGKIKMKNISLIACTVLIRVVSLNYQSAAMKRRGKLKIMAKEIKRVIFVSDLSEVDFNNFGLHFTEDLNYTHKNGGSNGLTPDGEIKVTVYCKKYKTNTEATRISREGYPREKETVLQPNQELKCEISVMKNGKPVSFEEGVVNTGTRCDKWVKNI